MKTYERPNILATVGMDEIVTEAFGGSGCEDHGHNNDGCHGIGDIKLPDL
ncbi:MAG: hypothetical protein NVS2B3_17350 [Vulcanimicrobiaceae bacterium]